MNDVKEIVHTYVNAFNSGDLDGLCKLFAPDALVWGVLGWGSVEQVKPICQDLIECLSMQLHIEQLVAEDDTVAVRYTERGKSQRAFRGAGPTGKEYELIAMEWFQIKDGLIHRRWGVRDSASQSRQLGF